jgi:hypothetical protein
MRIIQELVEHELSGMSAVHMRAPVQLAPAGLKTAPLPQVAGQLFTHLVGLVVGKAPHIPGEGLIFL